MKKSLLLAGLTAVGLTVCACSGGAGNSATSTKSAAATTAPTASQSSQPASSGSSTQPAGGSTTPASGTSSSAPTEALGCLSRYLNGSIGLTQGTAGSVYVTIVFKNLDNYPCTMYGFPGVAQAAGRPVTDIGQPSTESTTSTRELITLAPGGYANATLQITDADNYSASTCDPTKADWLAVIPPNQTVPLYIHYSSLACKSQSVKLLTVTAVRPGNGGSA